MIVSVRYQHFFRADRNRRDRYAEVFIAHCPQHCPKQGSMGYCIIRNDDYSVLPRNFGAGLADQIAALLYLSKLPFLISPDYAKRAERSILLVA
ncbi:MAG: hypothetical protein R6V59_03215 [Dehalococcoidia bacterium]